MQIGNSVHPQLSLTLYWASICNNWCKISVTCLLWTLSSNAKAPGRWRGGAYSYVFTELPFHIFQNDHKCCAKLSVAAFEVAFPTWCSGSSIGTTSWWGEWLLTSAYTNIIFSTLSYQLMLLLVVYLFSCNSANVQSRGKKRVGVELDIDN